MVIGEDIKKNFDKGMKPYISKEGFDKNIKKHFEPITQSKK